MIRLHTYPDGLTGLAAFCDVCGEQITERGYLVWRGHDGIDQQPFGVMFIHQGRCDPGRRSGYGWSMPLDIEIAHLVNSTGVDLVDANRRAERGFK